jgi:hypothetical protein
MRILTNLRQDRFEHMNWPTNGFAGGSIGYWDSFKKRDVALRGTGADRREYLPSFIEYTGRE